jgi:glycosyltransferase involved in cell wall biosynthesis
MAEPPIISVCLITYNHEKYITQAIEGVLQQQTNYKYELVIADDCSNDNTGKILNEYAGKYPDIIRLILQEKNIGPAKNWIDLITSPKGKYIAYFEGDDYWKATDKLQKQVDFLEQHEDYVACCGNAVYVRDGIEVEKVRNWSQEKVITIRDILYGNDIITGTILFRNKLSPQFYRLLKNAYAGDWILFYYLSRSGKFYYSPEILTAYRIHAEGAWNKLSLVQKLRSERNMKVIFLKDNLINRNAFILLKEIVKLNWDLMNIRIRKSIRNIFGNKVVDRVKQYKGS